MPAVTVWRVVSVTINTLALATDNKDKPKNLIVMKVSKEGRYQRRIGIKRRTGIKERIGLVEGRVNKGMDGTYKKLYRWTRERTGTYI